LYANHDHFTKLTTFRESLGINMKNKLKITTLLASSCLLSSQVSAVDIDLTIVGKGKVNVSENSVECTETCTITNDEQINTLVATAEGSERFIGWTGQQCDSGNQVLVDQNFNIFHEVSDGAKTLSVADIDNNGSDDLALISLFNGQVKTLTNQGGGNFASASVVQNLNYPSALDFYDWDNDGDQDLLVAAFNDRVIKVYSNNGNGEFSHSNDISLDNKKVYALAIEDMNNDGYPDLAVSIFRADTSGNLSVLVNSINDSETRWYVNDGNGGFNASTVISEIAAITLDVHKHQDSGTIDVVAAEIQSGDIATYRLADGEVTRNLVANSDGAYGAAFSDIDNDGNMDVLSAHYEPSLAMLTYGNDDGSYSGNKTIKNFTEGVTATAFIDVNSDNYIDTLIGEFNTGQFGYLETTSYKDCVVSSSSKMSITANFSNDATTPVTPPPPVKNDDSSGGGSFGYALFSLVLLAGLRRRK